MKIQNNNPFCFTENVCLELSNMCPYADKHKKCPVNLLQQEKNILPAKIVYDVLITLGTYDFKETISFHTYNEPLMDPRLSEFIKFAKTQCPESDIHIWTNGYYLNKNLALELIEAGVSRFSVYAYTEAEEIRLKKITDVPNFVVQQGDLDNRLNLYTSEKLYATNPCFAPLTQIIITAKGLISLCCLDWQRNHCFSDLNVESFEKAIKNKKMWTAYKKLSTGDRFFDLCQRCDWSR